MTNSRSVSSGTRTNTSNRQDLILFYVHLRFSFKSDLTHQLDDKLGEFDNFQSLEVYDLSEENGLDTYMSIEVPVSEGDEARSLSQEELGQSPEDY